MMNYESAIKTLKEKELNEIADILIYLLEYVERFKLASKGRIETQEKLESTQRKCEFLLEQTKMYVAAYKDMENRYKEVRKNLQDINYLMTEPTLWEKWDKENEELRKL